MKLSGRILQDVGSVNSFEVAEALEFNTGDTLTVYIQLVDLSLDKDLRPAGRRYVPLNSPIEATLTITLNNIDSAIEIADRVCSQAYPGLDESIWKFNILATDTIKGTVNALLKLNENSVITTGRVKGLLRISAESC